MALPGDAYVFYAEQPQITVNLLGLEQPSQASAEWIDTWTGARAKASLGKGGVLRLVRKPETFGQAPGLLIVRSFGGK